MKPKLWTMTYDPEYNRWMVKLEGHRYGLHCGEVFELFIGENHIPCRIELDLDKNWYVILPGAKFYLRRRDTYKVEI